MKGDLTTGDHWSFGERAVERGERGNQEVEK